MEIDKNEFTKLLPSAPNIIDIREHYLYTRSHLPNSLNIPTRILRDLPEKYLDRNKTYYLICETGFHSQRLALRLREKGYDVYSIKGGYEGFCSIVKVNATLKG